MEIWLHELRNILGHRWPVGMPRPVPTLCPTDPADCRALRLVAYKTGRPRKNVDSRLCVINGQHTAIAAVSRSEIGKVPAVVVAAASVKQRAAALISHSALAAGDEIAVAVDQACKAAGVTVKRTQPAKWAVGDTVAIVSIRRLVEKEGIGSATRVLKALKTAQRAPIVSNEVRAAGAVLFDKELGWQGEIFDLVTVIRSKSADDWMRLVEIKRKGDAAPPVWLAVAQAWLRQLKRPA